MLQLQLDDKDGQVLKMRNDVDIRNGSHENEINKVNLK